MTPEEAADALDGAFFSETLSDRREELMTLQAFAREPRAMTPDGFVDKAELERRFKEQIVRLRAVHPDGVYERCDGGVNGLVDADDLAQTYARVAMIALLGTDNEPEAGDAARWSASEAFR